MQHRTLCLALLLAFLSTLGLGSAVIAGEEAEEALEPVVTLKTNRGNILLRFFPDSAPEHVKNFIAHCESGFYEGCLFHRVIPGFMIQSGDPKSKDDDPGNDGTGGYSYQGPGTNLKAEFNERKHVRGILSMARGNAPNSAGSQFFICQVSYPSLDGKYTAFGQVIEGIGVVDKIAKTKRDANDRPLRDQIIEDIVIEDWPTKLVEETLAKMQAEDKGPRK